MFYTLSRAIKEEKKNEEGVRQLEVKKGERARSALGEEKREGRRKIVKKNELES